MKMVFSLIASLIGVFACESASPFHKKDGQWYFESHKLGVAATTALTPLNDRFARVGDRIFYREDGIHGADSATFVALNLRALFETARSVVARRVEGKAGVGDL